LIVRTGQFELLEFIDYARSKWRFVAIAAAVAVLTAAVAAWSLTPRYTATASILIDAPGGADPGSAAAVTPVYLESLRTYEHFASSDSLFAEATARLHIRERYAGVPIESLKSRVLKVQKPRDTKILEISVTLGDPKKAQALAQYIAEKTVSLNRSLDRSAEDDLADDIRARVDAAKFRVAAADRELAAAAAQGTDALRSELEAGLDLKARLRRDLVDTKTDLAALVGEEPASGDRDRVRSQIAALRARVAELEHQQAAAEAEVPAKEALLGKREAHLDTLRLEQKSAQAQLDAAIARLNEITLPGGIRSERLKIIDPGIVPERPRSPNPLMLVFAALFISSVLSLIYIAVAFYLGQPRLRLRDRPRAYG
jgi:capsular polysaccharide biosynthesis protein